MEKNENVVFTQKWMEKAVRACLGKEDGKLTVSDLEQIKYLRTGESFDNDFFIEVSREVPPEPFADTDGGDEWIFALRDDDIKRFLDDGDTDFSQLYVSYTFEHEENMDACSQKAVKAWEQYRESICGERYYESFEDEDEWEKWYQNTAENTYRDISYFKGIRVLRIQGLKIPDYTVFAGMDRLAVLELAETVFQDKKGYEKLYDLKQLSCWLD